MMKDTFDDSIGSTIGAKLLRWIRKENYRPPFYVVMLTPKGEMNYARYALDAESGKLMPTRLAEFNGKGPTHFPMILRVMLVDRDGKGGLLKLGLSRQERRN